MQSFSVPLQIVVIDVTIFIISQKTAIQKERIRWYLWKKAAMGTNPTVLVKGGN